MTPVGSVLAHHKSTLFILPLSQMTDFPEDFQKGKRSGKQFPGKW
jgi:hypothetical protein